MKRTNAYAPDYATHPGEVLAEELAERGLLQADLCRATGYTAKHVNQVIKWKAAIGPAFAVALERALDGPSAQFWLNMQAARHLHEYRAGRSLDVS